MLTRENAIERVKDFTNAITASGLPLDKVILFGSYAKDFQQEYSDIDVALVSNMFSVLDLRIENFLVKLTTKKTLLILKLKHIQVHILQMATHLLLK